MMKTVMQPDAARIRETVRAIEAAPHLWNQNSYSGTNEHGQRTYCLAGWTLHLDGRDVTAMLRKHQGNMRVFDVAMRVLGLDRHQAHMLFAFWGQGERHPTVEQLKSRITEVTGVTFP